MKIMYIGKDHLLLDTIKSIFKDEDYDYIQYRDPGKALNNIKEIDPDILFLIDDHYPQKGKTVRKLLSSSPIPHETVCIFLSKKYENKFEDRFYFINSELNTNENSDYLNSAIRKKDKTEGKIQFIFTHPITPGFITGVIDKVEGDIIEFLPDYPDAAASIVENTTLKSCTLKIEEKYFNLPTQLLHNGNVMRFQMEKKITKKVNKAIKQIQK